MAQHDQTGFVTYPCTLGPDPYKTAIVFGPVSPTWSGGDFCAPLVQALSARGYTVHVIDSIPLLLTPSSQEQHKVLNQYVEYVTSKFGVPELITGYAYGGTLAMALSPLFPNTPDVISVSGPGYANKDLLQQIGALITALKAGKLDDALELLAHSVAPIGSKPSPLHRDQLAGSDRQHAIDRMIAGFEFLLRLDLRTCLSEFDGRLLAITGELSKLATKETLGFQPSAHQQFIHAEIPEAGMRVLLEAPTASLQVLSEWI